MPDQSTVDSLFAPEPVVTAYLWGGSETTPDNDLAIAKKAVDATSGRVQCWVKRAGAGPEQGWFFNPQSPIYTEMTRARGKYHYVKATPEQFEAYMRFATAPHNPIHLRHAERCT